MTQTANKAHEVTMSCRFIINALLLTISATGSYAIDPQQLRERERHYVPAIRNPEQLYRTPVVSRDRQEQQRRETPQGGVHATADFRSPQTVSIDRLKLRSDTLAEYQFEQVQTLPTPQDESAPAAEAKHEEPLAAEAEQPEQPADEVAAAEPAPEDPATDTDTTPEQVVTGGGKAQFRIIEENDRIIVTQVDTPPTHPSTAK